MTWSYILKLSRVIIGLCIGWYAGLDVSWAINHKISEGVPRTEFPMMDKL